MTRFIALAALGLSVVACIAVPVYMQRQTQQAIDRALRQREAQLVERYKPLLHELGDRYMAAAAFENAQTVDQMVDALVQIVRAAAEAERQAKLEQGNDAETASTEESASEPTIEGTSRLVNHESGSTVPRGGRSKRERSGAVVESSMESEAASEVQSDRLEGQIAYVASQGGFTDVHLMNADGSDDRQLTYTRAMEKSVALSSDGERLAFVVDEEGRRDVFVIHTAGGTPINLTKEMDWSIDPTVAWLPNDKDLVVTVRENGRPKLLLFDVEKREATDFLDDADHPAWSPDSARLAFRRDMRLAIGDPVGADVTIVGSEPERKGLVLFGPHVWLPDGHRVIFCSLADPTTKMRPADDRNFSVYSWDVSSQSLNRITQTASPEFPVGCSPDGRTLLLLTVDQDHSRISTIGIDGTRRRLLLDESRQVEWASWSVKPTEIAQR